MQRIGNIFENFVSYENLLIAFKKARRGTKNYQAAKFEFNLEYNLCKLKEELEKQTYTPDKYRYFILKGLKERIISKASFKDRIVHHGMVNVLEDIFEKKFIFDSYANRKNKGLLKGIKRIQYFIKTNKEYYLKADIKKFFDNIDHTILIKLLEKKIKDKRIMGIIQKIIQNTENKDKGLPIGNLTSQFFANIYLCDFDHYVKEKLQIKKYVRYMDDFVIIDEDVNRLKQCKRDIAEYLNRELRLTLKKEATYFNKVDNGVTFCGGRIFKKLIRVKPSSIKISVGKIKYKYRLFKNGEITEDEFVQTLNSIFAYWKNYDTHKLRIDILEKLKL